MDIASKVDLDDPEEAPQDLRTMTVHEFWESGLLQEVNRRFLHPLGVALSVIMDTYTGKVASFGEVWDYRDDPEGLRFADETNAEADTGRKWRRVQAMWAKAHETRLDRLGYVVQPPAREGD